MGQRAYWSALEQRVGDWVDKTLRRKSTTEAKGAGSARVAAEVSPALRRRLLPAVETLADRGAFQRPLYAATLRASAGVHSHSEPQRTAKGVAAVLSRAMQTPEGGGLCTLAVVSDCSAASIREPLARLAGHAKPPVAFAASLAMRRRGEGRPGQLMRVVARIKESARIELCNVIFAPRFLTSDLPELPNSICPTLRVLRESERHLGRWLVLARAGYAAGDTSALEEAEARSLDGSASSRSAWTLIHWALGQGSEREKSKPPSLRPSAEIVARLSDRPTSERDLSFLFRLSEARAEGAQPMLEGYARAQLKTAVAVRAAAGLARHYRHAGAVDSLRRVADEKKPRDLLGLTVAALWDAGLHEEAQQRAEELVEARSLGCAVWGGLVLKARPADAVLSETRYRHIELGWIGG